MHWVGTVAPASPQTNADPEMRAVPGRTPEGDRRVTLSWDNASELRADPILRKIVFQGYRLWRVDGWSRPARLQRIEAAGIFEYMDGAGELYLAYRFGHLDVVEFASPDQGEILVELYWMRTSDDAYGLLSGDWGGEPVSLKDPIPASGPRALYGAGLLRIWSDGLYARVMATRESDASARVFSRTGAAGIPSPSTASPSESPGPCSTRSTS